jgi:molybdopterin-guanine dinucleotide biosynthesis protein A
VLQNAWRPTRDPHSIPPRFARRALRADPSLRLKNGFARDDVLEYQTTIAVYHPPVNDLTAFVLAGGKSARMGKDKAFLTWQNGTFLSHACQLAGSAASEVRIVGDAKKFAAFGSVVEDIYRDCGPLGGIHAALTHSPTDLNLMLAVDLPFLESKFLKYLVAQARESDSIVTIPRIREGWQPLCAVYRRAFAGIAEESLREGKNKIDLLFAEIENRVIDEAELSQAGFNPEMFRNLNTPDDLKEATRRTPTL